MIITKNARLGLNGPAVIEQEAGIDEYDAGDRPMVWGVSGGAQRVATGFVDKLVQDDVKDVVKAAILGLHEELGTARCEQFDKYLSIFEQLDKTSQFSPELAIQYFSQEGAAQ